mmetsp:Transcript_1/g.3  ORF Transcript_1/g.3 Transcript_1/m.3 type:complete len:490 (+) Transcript_1:89-1558(+)
MSFALLPASICGYDVDDIFAYSTVKQVTIRDARLGLLFYALNLGIAVYILIYQLCWQGGYLSFVVPTNSVRMSLQQPTASDGRSCNPNKVSCHDNFTSPAVLPYCWTSERKTQNISGVSFPTLNCSYMDGADASSLRGKSILMTTSVHAYEQKLNAACETTPGSYPSSSCQKLWTVGSDAVWYVVDPERFTLLVDHAATAAGVRVDPTKLKGYLLVEAGGPSADSFCRENAGIGDLWDGGRATGAPCYVRPFNDGGSDYFTVGFLLRAMQLSLDTASRAPATRPQTVRSSGIIVRVSIEYYNFWVFHLGTQQEIRYVYTLTPLRQSSYREARIVNTHYPRQRVKQDLHGIRFEFQTGGSLGKFDFTEMLIQLTTSLALLAVSTTVVNLLAQYILKYSEYYRRAMFTSSPDFSDLRAANRLSDEELDGQLRGLQLRVSGDRVSKVMRLLAAGWTESHMSSGGTAISQAQPATFTTALGSHEGVGSYRSQP